MNEQDWKDYYNYLMGLTFGKNLMKPASIGEAYNNKVTLDDMRNVRWKKLKRKNPKK